jgi:hypothetical protein
MSLLANLPVDIHSPTEHEQEVIDILFKEEQNNTGTKDTVKRYPFLQGFEEGLSIVVLFLIFCSPQMTEVLHKFPFIASSIAVEYVVKIIMILVLFGILKKYYL